VTARKRWSGGRRTADFAVDPCRKASDLENELWVVVGEFTLGRSKLRRAGFAVVQASPRNLWDGSFLAILCAHCHWLVTALMIDQAVWS
jgi:hypothetical protein